MPFLFPEASREAVERALTAAFGTTVLDGATPLSGGLSGAGIWRIRVGGIAYLLRVETPAHTFGDARRGYPCMRIAAEACLAPRLYYACAADGVAIMDLVETRSLAFDYPGEGGPLIVELAQALRVLHEAQPFPARTDYMADVTTLIGHAPRMRLLDPTALEEVLAGYAALASVYRTRDADRVSGHNDISPSNVLYDGRRLWLIDWELACLADRYVDLAAVANWFAPDAAGQALLLTTYFRAPPTAAQRARLYLMGLAGHVFYGLVWLFGAAVERPGEQLPDRGLDGPSFDVLRQEILAGERSFADWDTRVACAKARLAAARDGLTAPAYAAAVAALD